MAANSDHDGTDGRGEADPCPVIDLFEQIGSEWRLVVLYDLQGSEKRFSELRRSTDAPGSTLSRVLDDLRGAGLVARRVEDASPVATYYRLTGRGASLCPVFEAMERWAEEWLATPVEDSRQPPVG